MLFSKYDGTFLPDNAGKAILVKENADIQSIKKGGSVYSFKRDAELVLKYPIDFIIRWLNRLFLGISIDNDRVSFVYLFTSYTLLFLALLTIKDKCKKLKDILDLRLFLLLALVTPSLVPCLEHVEMRYFMSIQILIAGTALLADTLWNSLSGFKDFAASIIINRKNRNGEIRINYPFVSYVIFITLCFMLFATQYELRGPSPSILFKF
jgi:hypothetical protein